jgi:hypothetical protein
MRTPRNLPDRAKAAAEEAQEAVASLLRIISDQESELRKLRRLVVTKKGTKKSKFDKVYARIFGGRK